MKAFLTIILTIGFIKQVSANCDPPCLPDEVCQPQPFVGTTNVTTSTPVTFLTGKCVCNSTIYDNPDFASVFSGLPVTCNLNLLMVNITYCQAQIMKDYGFILPDKNNEDNPYFSGILLSQQRTTTYYFNVSSTSSVCEAQPLTNDIYLTYSVPVWYRNNGTTESVVLYNDIMVNYTCSFPLTMNASLDVSFNPIRSPDRLTTGRFGSYILTMQLFKFSDFTGSYSVSDLPIQFRLGKLLHIGASVMGLDPKFSVKIVSCYATPTSDPDDPIKYFFISESCPVVGFIQLTFLKDGNGPAVYFSMKVFKLGSYPRVHVHCTYSICEGVCEPSCSSR